MRSQIAARRMAFGRWLCRLSRQEAAHQSVLDEVGLCFTFLNNSVVVPVSGAMGDAPRLPKIKTECVWSQPCSDTPADGVVTDEDEIDNL